MPSDRVGPWDKIMLKRERDLTRSGGRRVDVRPSRLWNGPGESQDLPWGVRDRAGYCIPANAFLGEPGPYPQHRGRKGTPVHLYSAAMHTVIWNPYFLLIRTKTY